MGRATSKGNEMYHCDGVREESQRFASTRLVRCVLEQGQVQINRIYLCVGILVILFCSVLQETHMLGICK